MERITRTGAAGGAGFLGGLLLEKGLESLAGVEFVDGVMAVAGSAISAAHVNRDLIEAASRNIRHKFDKEPEKITKEEWKEYKEEYPKSAEYLEKALGI